MKKRLLVKIAVLLALPIAYIITVSGFKEANITNPGSQTSTGNPKDFVNYILAPGYQDSSNADPYRMYWNMDRHINSYKELNFNSAHMYESDSDSLGKFEQSVLSDTQRNNVDDLIDLAGNNNMRSIFMRNRIGFLCYSQRLVYEISSNGSNTVNYGFTYQDIKFTYTTDTGRTVVKAQTGSDTADWLCKNIYENMQHTDLYYLDQGASDTGLWFAKPVMRIKKEIFDNITMRNVPVVKINVINFSGDTINSVVLRVQNFRNSNFEYTGQYIDKYTFEYNMDSLRILGGFDTLGLNHGFQVGMSPDESKVDFQVYWYGLVDVWFDKMVVDDELADHLFNGTYDNTIKDETTKESFDEIIYFLKKSKTIQPSNYLSINYVLNKMESYLAEYNIAQAR